MSETKSKESRSRTWTFVLYPESAPENWRDLLDEHHVEWVESPLHDRDINPDGELKKVHIHILLLFSSVKSYEQICVITDALNCPIPQRCHDAKSLVKYMAHLHNPEKAQYDVSQIIGHNGADVMNLLSPNASERYTLIREMIEFVEVNDIVEFKDLMCYAAQYRFSDWFPLLCDNSAFVISLHIKSNRHRSRSVSCERIE